MFSSEPMLSDPALPVEDRHAAVDHANDPWPGENDNVASLPGIIVPRLLVGWIVLISAEVLSGASLGIGLWHPWTLVLTYWLYFAHFFFFTTLAIRTGRTSLGSLYLWGVLYGLYESWITKVIWFGYGGDGKLAMGRIGPYGLSEMTMVFFFHPVLSFIVPIGVACMLWPPLAQLFPDLGPFFGRGRLAWVCRAFLVVSFAPVVAMNGGGPANVALNAAFLAAVLVVRLARPWLALSDGTAVLEMGRGGFAGVCVYLVALYALTYAWLRPEGLPSWRVQAFTFVFYGLAILGLKWQGRQDRRAGEAVVAADALRGTVATLALILGLGALLSFAPGNPLILVPVLISFVSWIALSDILPVAVLLRAAAVRAQHAPVGGPG